MYEELQSKNEENDAAEDRNRVSVEALAFDWIFIENNPENLINVLANLDHPEVLGTKPITMFINFIWSYY